LLSPVIYECPSGKHSLSICPASDGNGLFQEMN
jgi:hypothetical protein